MCLDPPSEYFGQNRRFSQRTKRLYHTNTAAAMTGNIWVGFLILWVIHTDDVHRDICDFHFHFEVHF